MSPYSLKMKEEDNTYLVKCPIQKPPIILRDIDEKNQLEQQILNLKEQFDVHSIANFPVKLNEKSSTSESIIARLQNNINNNNISTTTKKFVVCYLIF